MRWIVVLIAMIGAGPATRPTAAPTSQAAMPVNISLDEAIRQRQAAVTACLARIRSTPSYRAEGEKRDLAAAKLEFSRKYG
ncbi:MAG TPA: hypothetical protein VIM11_09160, partial [Tepidisphaeraceae bacterium]